MEGTRHEKVGIIITSYLIGFTTAFIAFGLNKVPAPEVADASIPAAVVPAEENNGNAITSVSIGDDGLFALSSGYERLLAADKKSLGASIASASDTPGFYYNMVDAEVSRNGQFVYFCEQLSESDDFCNPYVYSLSDDSLHAVKLDNQTYTSSIVDHQSSWSDNNILMLNGMNSVNENTPWVFATVKPEVQ